MVFAIGWSGVSIASVNSMQISMQHQQMMNDHHNMTNMSVPEMKAHCNDMQQQDHASSAINHDQQMQDLKDCHTQLIQSKHAQHSECQDCALFSCQSSIVWFNSEVPKLLEPEHSQNNNFYQIAYQAQHLAGHWQEILRPPKA